MLCSYMRLSLYLSCGFGILCLAVRNYLSLRLSCLRLTYFCGFDCIHCSVRFLWFAVSHCCGFTLVVFSLGYSLFSAVFIIMRFT